MVIILPKNENKDMDVAKNPMLALKRLWKYLIRQKKLLILITVMVIISSIASIVAPLLMKMGVDNYISKNDLDGLALILIILAIIYVVNSLISYFNQFIMVKVTEKSLYNLRKDLFEHLEKLSLSFFDRNKKGDLMSRFTNDITTISDALSDAVVQVISSLIILIGVTIVMFVVNPILAFVTIITVPFFFIAVFKIGGKAGVYFFKQQKNLGDLNAYSEEMISGMKVIKSYVKEEDALEEFRVHNQRFKDISIKSQLYANLIIPANVAMTNISDVLMIAVGAILTLNNMATVGTILAFFTFSNMFRRPINQLGSLYSSIQSALAGAERVFEIMDEPIEIKDVKNALTFDKIKGDVSLKEVNFSYVKGKPVLKNINIEVKAGEYIALVGPTGAGKTTIVNLLTRFYDIDSGKITIDGIDISKVKKEDLRHKIGIVLQDTYLFKGTVKDNIRYGKMNASDEEVIEAAKKAQAHNFIHRLPNGYESFVDEEGSNFSQGQRQLISIARAILADPQILILDEATSSVDTRTEIEIQKGMLELMKNRTSFVIAHRLSTIRDAKEILVLNNGEIIERGNHEGLLEQKGFYYDLYMSQFN